MKAYAINIRAALTNDLDLLAELFDAYRVFYKKNTDVEAAKEFLKERLSRHESEIFVAEDEASQLVGFVQLYPLFSSTRMKRIWLLNDLFVSPDYRGKNISIQLIDKAKELARETNACGLMLETAKTNMVGNNLYPRAGFELDHDHNFYAWDI